VQNIPKSTATQVLDSRLHQKACSKKTTKKQRNKKEKAAEREKMGR